MDIEIKQCNNIISAKFAISPNRTGKSTISKAIQFSAADNVKA
jgi:hypothetical protein